MDDIGIGNKDLQNHVPPVHHLDQRYTLTFLIALLYRFSLIYNM